MKLKMKMFLLFILCIPIFAQAQVILTAQIPSNGILLKEQIWNVVITNNTTNTIDAKLDIDITDLQTGQSVLNASTGRLNIAKGMRVLTSKEVQPVTYNFASTEFSGNYLPCGSYRMHYRVVLDDITKLIIVADEIINIVVAPLSPPLLSYPADKEGIDNVYPQFVWMTPIPTEMFNPLLYNINVVAVEEGQSPKEAIEYNKSVYYNLNIQSPIEKMATSFEQLQKGKKYAWQVIAQGGMTCAMPSEIFTFTIGKDSLSALVNAAPYIRLSQKNTEVSIVLEGFIKMEYINNINDKEVSCKVYKVNTKEGKDKKVVKFKLKIDQGQNYLTYDMNKYDKLDSNEVYEVCLTNGRGEQWFMKFIPVYKKK